MRYGLSCRSYISASNKKINDKPWHSYMYKNMSPTSIKMFSVKSDSYKKSSTLSGVDFGTNLLCRIGAACFCYRFHAHRNV